MAFKTFFKIAEANSEVARIGTELTNAQTALENLKGDHTKALEKKDTEHATALAGVNEQLSTVTTERDTARTELATAKTELATAQAEIKTLKGEAKSTDEKAAEIAATVGTPAAVKAEGNTESKTKEQLWTEYAALPIGEAQNKFYAKHRAQMRD